MHRVTQRGFSQVPRLDYWNVPSGGTFNLSTSEPVKTLCEGLCKWEGFYEENSTILPKQHNNRWCFAGAMQASVPCECSKSSHNDAYGGSTEVAKKFVLGCVILPLTWGSGRPKGLSFGFRPKFSVSVSAETFRQKLTFRPKEQFWQKWHISTEITFFRHLSAQFQNQNKLINGSNIKEGYFGPNAFFRFLPALSVSFGFRPKFKLFKWALTVSAETLSVGH